MGALSRVRDELSRRGYRCETRKVRYEFQKGADEMLIIRRGIALS